MIAVQQGIVDWLKKLPQAIRSFTLAQKLAVLFAFLGSASLVYAGVTLFGQQAQMADQEVSFSLENIPPVSVQASSSASLPMSRILVDVSGAVVQPGVYELDKTGRVSDAVSKAGGFAKTADRAFINTTINLAQPVQDAMKIYIPFKGERVGEEQYSATPSPSSKTPQSATTINANSATLAELDALKGIGTTRAQQIITNRPYVDLADFASKSGLSAALIDQISGQLVF